MYRGFEALFPRFLIVFIIINRRFKNLQSVQLIKQLQKASKAMHTNGTVAAVFCFCLASRWMRTASGLVKGGLLRGKQSEPVKSVYLDPWLPETARYNFSDKSENAERLLQALTRRPKFAAWHSLQKGLEPKRKPSARPCRLLLLPYNKVVFFNAPRIFSKCSKIRSACPK